MYLYGQRDEFVDVYSFEPIADKVREYKICEMEKLKSKNILFKAVTNETVFPLAVNHLKDNTFIDFDDINYSRKRFLGERFHIISNKCTLDERNKTLSDYYDGRFSFEKKVVVATEKSLIHLLLTQDAYILHPEKRGLYVMANIMYLPENLVHLHNMENGYFNSLRYFSSSLEKMADLFVFNDSPIYSIEREDVNQLSNFGFLNEEFINKKIEQDTNAVKILKKSYNKKVL